MRQVGGLLLKLHLWEGDGMVFCGVGIGIGLAMAD